MQIFVIPALYYQLWAEIDWILKSDDIRIWFLIIL